MTLAIAHPAVSDVRPTRRRFRAVEPVRAVRGRGVAREEAAFRPAAENAGRRALRAQAGQPPVHDGAVVAQNVFHAAFDADRETSLSYATRAYRQSEALTLSTPVRLCRVA
jgi:hypothetical protein